MKKSLILTLVLSFPALACPELQGKYSQCTSLKGILPESRDLVVKKMTFPRLTFFSFNSRGEETLIVTNGIESKDQWEEGGENLKKITSARCLSDNLLQVRTSVTRGEESILLETSQYYRQGKDMVRISRGRNENGRFMDILTCR